MPYILFNQATQAAVYYDLKEPLQKSLNPYSIILNSSTFWLIYDNLYKTDNEIKILGTLVNFELKLEDVLILKIPNSQELLATIRNEFSSSFIGYVSDDYDRINAKKFYEIKLKYRSIRILKRAIKSPLSKVVPTFYSEYGWNQSAIEEINSVAIGSLKPIHSHFDRIKEKLKIQLNEFKKFKLVNK